jgi:predicted nucleic acid-binding protein
VYLVDTNVISAFSPAAAHGNETVRAWLEAQSANLYLSVVTVAEIESGVAKAAREGATRKAGRLAAWLESVLHLYGDRILPVTTGAARLAGRLADKARGAGASPGFADILIAATASDAGLTILTRNTKHFAALDVAVMNPWDSLAL